MCFLHYLYYPLCNRINTIFWPINVHKHHTTWKLRIAETLYLVCSLHTLLVSKLKDEWIYTLPPYPEDSLSRIIECVEESCYPYNLLRKWHDLEPGPCYNCERTLTSNYETKEIITRPVLVGAFTKICHRSVREYHLHLQHPVPHYTVPCTPHAPCIFGKCSTNGCHPGACRIWREEETVFLAFIVHIQYSCTHLCLNYTIIYVYLYLIKCPQVKDYPTLRWCNCTCHAGSTTPCNNWN